MWYFSEFWKFELKLMMTHTICLIIPQIFKFMFLPKNRFSKTTFSNISWNPTFYPTKTEQFCALYNQNLGHNKSATLVSKQFCLYNLISLDTFKCKVFCCGTRQSWELLLPASWEATVFRLVFTTKTFIIQHTVELILTRVI